MWVMYDYVAPPCCSLILHKLVVARASTLKIEKIDTTDKARRAEESEE